MARDNNTLLVQLEQIYAKRKPYVVKQIQKERRDLADNPTMNEVHLVLQTLINDLKKQGILK